MTLQIVVSPADTRRELRRPGVQIFALLVVAGAIIASVNMFAASYVSGERYIYYWDWSRYWLKFAVVGDLVRTNVLVAIEQASASIKYDDYNVIPVIPLIPFELIFGPGRPAYILAIANAYLVPAAALMAWIAERTTERRSWWRLLFCTALLLCLHVLWAPALRGLPDAFGLIIACLVLLTWFHKPAQFELLRLVGLGSLLCLLILTRRWYAFWAVGFLVAAALANFAVSPRGRSWTQRLRKPAELATAAVICVAFALILAAPLISRMMMTNYSMAYAAYRSDLAGGGGPIGQILNHFGVALLTLCTLGLVCLIRRRASRELGILLAVQTAMAVGLFSCVQSFLGVQHYYLAVPAAGISLSALVIALWDAPWQPIWRAAVIAIVSGLIFISSLAVFLPAPGISNPLLPSVRFPPLVRPDLVEIDRLMDKLDELKPERVYVAASSETLNWSILRVACRVRHKDLCPHIAVSADIDARDGFPASLLRADYVVVGTPIQYHVRPADQQDVGLVADHIIQHSGIGSSLQPVPGRFELMHGVHAQIYRRVAPLRNEDIQSLGDELAGSYPDMKPLFMPPRDSAD